MEIETFQTALNISGAYSKRHLLLGNGFSIACDPTIFTYESLYHEADFSENPQIKQCFELLGTTDFELVIDALDKSSSILPAYNTEAEGICAKMVGDSNVIKDLLIRTISARHPSIPTIISQDKYDHCRRFLSIFLHKDNGGKVYTLNYDLLLYWTLMHELDRDGSESKISDGFGRDTIIDNGEVIKSNELTWQGGILDQNIHYMHGALHLYDAGYELQKFSWIDTGKRLIEQAREALQQGKFPLFVTEGDSSKKMEKITHSAYLFNSYRSFEVVTNGGLGRPGNTCLFTYGVSFSKNDDHILYRIAQGKIKHLFVSIYGDPYSDENRQIISKVEAMKSQRKEYPLQVTFYDAQSAAVWG